AAGRLQHADAAGMRLAYVTNNASRTPQRVAAHLVELGVAAGPDDVVTSAQAAAHVLAGDHGRAAEILVLGAEGLEQALREESLVPVTGRHPDPVAVVSGHGPDVPWRRIMAAAVLIRDGLPWVACNTDMSVPTSRGLAPGHGTQV